jgi:signal transduction histidine kinase
MPGNSREANKLQNEFAAGALMTPVRRHYRTAFILAAIIILTNGIIFPFSGIQLEKYDSFIPAYNVTIIITYALLAVFGFFNYYKMGMHGFIIIGLGYISCAFFAALHSLSFADDSLLGGGQTGVYLWTFWYAGFPLFVFAFACVEKAAPAKSGRSAALVGAFALFLALALALLATMGDGHLPELVEDGIFHPMNRWVVALVTITLNIAAIAWLWHRHRQRSVLTLWLSITMLAFIFEVFTTAHSGARFTLGWYGARLNGLFGSVLLLPIWMIENALLLRQQQRLAAMAETANAAKDRFLAAASHDLRQPFQAMRLLHSALAVSLSEGRQAEISDRLGKAIAAGEELLTSLLDISRLNAGQMAPKLEPVSVADVIEAVVSGSAPLAEEKGLKLKCHCPAMTVMTDKTMLRRVVANLTTNALRYTKSGGVLVACRRRQGALSIEVWDTGVGIPQDQLEMIFGEFYQVGGPDGSHKQGVGLGLSIVERLCHLLNYNLSVRSRVGKGSVFAVSIPLAAVEAHASHPIAA